MPHKEYADWRPLVASGVVCEEPCYVYGLIITADTTKGYATIYNGRSTSGAPSFVVKAVADTTVSLDFTKPLYFPQGLYIDFTSSITGAVGIYEAIKPGEE